MVEISSAVNISQRPMDILPLLCIVSVTLTGLTKGVGVLPDKLTAVVGGEVTFTTTVTPPEKPFLVVTWDFVDNNIERPIISSTSSDSIGPGYEGRIILNRFTGSLKLMGLTLSDYGGYRVTCIPKVGLKVTGFTELEILEPVSNVTLTANSTELVEFSSVSLSCSSSGSSPSFLWINSSSEVTASDRVQLTDGNSTLIIINVTRYDQGPYSCRVSNAVSDPVTSDPVNLYIYSPVSNVKANASSTDLVEFSSVSLSCSSSGSSLSFLWMNGSTEVTASDRVQLTDGNSTLTITSVTRYDQGPFRCHVFNPASDGTSDPVEISISFGPENIILNSPPEEHHAIGSTIRLSCSAVSRPSAQFQWILNDNLLRDTGSELTLMNIQMSQSGNYSCQAYNSKTLRYQRSQPSAISVLEKVSGASVISSTNQLIEGNSANLTCDGAGSIFTREWMKDGSSLTLTNDMILHDTNRVLSFLSLKKTDCGEYLCIISNPLNNTEAKYNMIINYGPENVQITGPSKVNVKQTLKLICSAVSTPSARYTWILNGKNISTNSAVFTKNMTELSDSGNYTCRALNEITGRTSSAAHRLSVTENRPTSACSAGCIAGIVIACFVILGGIAGGYFISKKRTKKSSNANNASRTGAGGQENTAYSEDQELNYADIRFFHNNDGMTVHLGLQKNSQNQVNRDPAAASSPPHHDVHIQRMKRPAPQPDTTDSTIYAQVQVRKK